MSSRRAFTLPETLVAIALFGLAASVLLMSVGNLMRGLARAEDSPKEIFLREFVLREALSKKSREELVLGGELMTPEGERLRWSAEVASCETADLHRLSLRFRSPSEARGDVVIVTLAYKPEWSDPAVRSARIATVRAQLGFDVLGGAR